MRCQGIVLVPLERQSNLMTASNSGALKESTSSYIYIEVAALETAYSNVCQFGAKVLKNISERHKRRYFTCLDPDGNTVEIIEAVPF